MARSKSLLDADRFVFKLYKRNLPKGELFYARFYERGSSVILADRSTGEADERRATAAAGKLLAKLPLAKLARAKASKATDGFEDAEKLRNMTLDVYFTWFWDSTKSDYIRDCIDAEKPLSNYYILSQSRSIAKHAATYQSFKSTTVQDANLFLVEQWMHHLKREGMSANVIVDAMTPSVLPSRGRASAASSTSRSPSQASFAPRSVSKARDFKSHGSSQDHRPTDRRGSRPPPSAQEQSEKNEKPGPDRPPT